MDLHKITAEFDQHLRGTRKHRYLRFEKRPDGSRRFRIFRPRETDPVALRAEFLRFVERFPRHAALERAGSFERRDPAADSALLIERLANAARTASGFSFVRMGDGEGRFVGPIRDYPHLFGQSKLIAKDVWYRYSDVPKDTFYDDLESAYRNASVAGYIPVDRVDAEAGTVWFGYLGCVSGNEFLAACRSDSDSAYDCLVRFSTNVPLVQDAVFAELLRAHRVGVVTCHANKEVFTKRFGLGDFEHVVIAPEAHPLLSNRSGHAKFYPTQFLGVMNDFAKSDAQLYLIGAGIFAKIFCERLRRLGKIGIDLGSELDRIAGVKTRSIL